MTDQNLPSWRDNPPPLVPVYFIDIVHLRQVIENRGISEFALELLLGYYLEFEMFEKAAVIRDYFDELDEQDVDPEVLKNVLESPGEKPSVPKAEPRKETDKGLDFDPFDKDNPFV